MEHRMRLYEFGPTRSTRARWMLQELGVDFEAVTVNLAAGEQHRPEFLRINPAGKVPVLVDDGVVLTESVAIALYLAEKYPGKGFFPADARQRAQVNRWLLFSATELEQPIWRIFRHTRLYPENLRLPGEIARAHGEAMAAGLSQKERRALAALLAKLADAQGLTPGVHPGYKQSPEKP